MNRREIIQSLGLLSTHVLFPTILTEFVSACQNPARAREDYSPVFFSPEEFDVIRQIVDIILPATNTRSASEVFTHHFLDEVFDTCLTAEQKAIIREGLSGLIPRFSSAEDKYGLLVEIDREAYNNDEESAYFRTIKQYALVGFFTSQEGAMKASNYVKIPGDYKGEITIDEDTLSYANTTLRYYL